MSTPRRQPEPNQPHASRGQKGRNARGESTNISMRGIGEAPNSRLKKFAIWFVIAMIVLFIILDFVDRANAKKKNSFHYQPTTDVQIDRTT